MAKRKPQAKRAPRKRLSSALPLVHLHAARIDIGAQEHWVAAPPDSDPQPVRRFGACTADLEALADWLKGCGVTTVAMASTGVTGFRSLSCLKREALWWY